MSSRFFGPNKFISDSNIKRWITSVNSASVNQQNLLNANVRTKFVPEELPSDPILDAAYAETRDFVDSFIKRDELAEIADELRFFDECDKEINADVQFEENGVPKLSSLPRPPSPPPIDYDQPDDRIVNAILEKMLEKPIFPSERHVAGIDEESVSDVTPHGSASKRSRVPSYRSPAGRTPDFLARQKIRQEIVKQNREKKEAEERTRKQEEVAKRELLAEAKRREAAEQKERELKARAEEEEIKKEMIKIKQQMENQRKLVNQLNSEKQAVTDAAEAAARAELDLELTKKKEIEDEVRVAMEEQRRLKLARIEQIMKARNAENVKLLQKCFKAWYNMILEDRVTVARFRAVSDWRRIIRSWNRWRSCTNNRVAERAAKQYAEEIRKDGRKENLAGNHYRRKLLSRYFQEWYMLKEREKDVRQAEVAKEERRAKMASFLAAATASAVVAQNVPEVTPVEICNPVISEQVDELFASAQTGFKLDLKNLSGNEASAKDERRTNSSKRLVKKYPQKQERLVRSAGSQKSQGKSNFAEDVLSSSQSEADDDTPKTAATRTGDKRSDRQKNIISLQRERIKDQQMQIKELSYARRQTEMMQQISKYEELLKGLDQLTKLTKKKPSANNEGAKSLSSGRTAKVEAPSNNDVEVGKDVSETPNEGECSESAQMEASPSDEPVVEEIQLQLTEVVKLFHATKASPTVSTPLSVQSSNTRVRSYRPPAESDFTKKMEERAEMRRRLKEEREKKKQEAEQKRIEDERQREEEQHRKEEDEKRAKVEELKRKRQLEKEREEQRQLQLQHEREMTAKAIEANTKRLVRYSGWFPWRSLIEQQHQKWETAVEVHSVNTQRKFLMAWAEFVREDLAQRRALANDFFEQLIVRRCFTSWLRYGNYMLILEQKADRHYRSSLLVTYFNKWDRYVDYERRKEIRDEDKADAHNVRRMCKAAFKAWRKIPVMIREERARKKRLEDMRRRVASILPDYNPTIPETPPPSQTLLSTDVTSDANAETTQ